MIPVVQERTSTPGGKNREHIGIEAHVDQRARRSILSQAIFVYVAGDKAKAGMKGREGMCHRAGECSNTMASLIRRNHTQP